MREPSSNVRHEPVGGGRVPRTDQERRDELGLGSVARGQFLQVRSHVVHVGECVSERVPRSV